MFIKVSGLFRKHMYVYKKLQTLCILNVSMCWNKVQGVIWKGLCDTFASNQLPPCNLQF
jgi:hypothetical protein